MNPTRHVPWITLALIATNIVVFLLWQPTFRGDLRQQAPVAWLFYRDRPGARGAPKFPDGPSYG